MSLFATADVVAGVAEEALQSRGRQASAGYVYVMGTVEQCHKIGLSADPYRRELDFPVMPSELRVIHVIATGNMQWLEKYMHRAFAHCRVRGEWFRLTDEDVAIICGVSTADAESCLPPTIVERHREWSDLVVPPDREARREPAFRVGQDRKFRMRPEDLANIEAIRAMVKEKTGVEITATGAIRLGLAELVRKFRAEKAKAR